MAEAAAVSEAESVSGSTAVDAFLAHLGDDLRAALQRLREQIAETAPEAVETIAYSVPAFRYRGRPLVSYSAGRSGTGPCALYVQSLAVMETHAAELRGWKTGKGTIHFTPDRPLPGDLVAMLVRERMAETDASRKR